MSAVATATVVGAGATMVAGSMEASAAGSAANAQRDAANAQLDFQKQNQANAIGALKGAISPSMMAQYDQSLYQQESHVQTLEKLANSLDPTLVNQGANINNSMMRNIQAQRQQQRQGLISQLNENGMSANSTAGMQQLQKFDLDTQNMTSNLTDTLTMQAAGLNQNAADLNANYNKMILSNPETQNARDQASTYEGTAGAINQAYGNTVGAAGNSGAGQMIAGQTIGNLGGQISSLGGALAAHYNTLNRSTPQDNFNANISNQVSQASNSFQMPGIGSTWNKPPSPESGFTS